MRFWCWLKRFFHVKPEAIDTSPLTPLGIAKVAAEQLSNNLVFSRWYDYDGRFEIGKKIIYRIPVKWATVGMCPCTDSDNADHRRAYSGATYSCGTHPLPRAANYRFDTGF